MDQKSAFVEWVKALESGEYKQGRGCLYDNVSDTYCCLGVLTDVVKHQFDIKKENYFKEYGDGIAVRNHRFLLPFKISNFMGSMSDLGQFPEMPDDIESLACLNDSEYDPKTFKEIAAVIRDIYKKRFGEKMP